MLIVTKFHLLNEGKAWRVSGRVEDDHGHSKEAVVKISNWEVAADQVVMFFASHATFSPRRGFVLGPLTVEDEGAVETALTVMAIAQLTRNAGIGFAGGMIDMMKNTGMTSEVARMLGDIVSTPSYMSHLERRSSPCACHENQKAIEAPCPFCGNDDEDEFAIMPVGRKRLAVKCTCCFATGPSAPTASEAIEEWNALRDRVNQ